jgi:pantothenate kinase type III
MQGLVTLDFGNSHPHAGLFHKTIGQWQLLKVVPLNELALSLQQFGMSAHNTSMVLSEVKPRTEELKHLEEQGFLITRVKEYWRGLRFAGMPVHYAKTLGEDRLIEAFYCYKKDRKPSLIIDAGTYTTIDVVTTKGFEGGYIIPSPETYFESFRKGEQLKDVPLRMQKTTALPKETPEAMAGGYSAFAALAQKLCSDYQLERVVLTGGLSDIWEAFLAEIKATLEIEKNPHLIHTALHYWMTTQIERL